jgi:hypothetical protein
MVVLIYFGAGLGGGAVQITIIDGVGRGGESGNEGCGARAESCGGAKQWQVNDSGRRGRAARRDTPSDIGASRAPSRWWRRRAALTAQGLRVPHEAPPSLGRNARPVAARCRAAPRGR